MLCPHHAVSCYACLGAWHKGEIVMKGEGEGPVGGRSMGRGWWCGRWCLVVAGTTLPSVHCFYPSLSLMKQGVRNDRWGRAEGAQGSCSEAGQCCMIKLWNLFSFKCTVFECLYYPLTQNPISEVGKRMCA